jgi:hypothetical protein
MTTGCFCLQHVHAAWRRYAASAAAAALVLRLLLLVLVLLLLLLLGGRQLGGRLYWWLTSARNGWESDIYLDAKVVPPVHVNSHLRSTMPAHPVGYSTDHDDTTA